MCIENKRHTQEENMHASREKRHSFRIQNEMRYNAKLMLHNNMRRDQTTDDHCSSMTSSELLLC